MVLGGAFDPTAPARSIGQADGPSDPAVIGEWDPPVELPEVAIHATLLHTGHVLMFVWPASRAGSEAWLWHHRTGKVIDVSVRSRVNLFCSGHSLLPDGRVLVTGGNAYGRPEQFGHRMTYIFDPEKRSWKKGPQMKFRRWYPSNLTLPNGRTLIVSGSSKPGANIERAEIFHPKGSRISLAPRSSALHLNLYPPLHLLPDGRAIKTANEARTWFLDPARTMWTGGPRLNSGRRTTSASILLPGLDRILVAGGLFAAEGHSETVFDSAEILDLRTDDPAWEEIESMEEPRAHSNGVLLADGTVLMVGGNQRSFYRDPVKHPELFDPATGSWTTMAPQLAPRGYHSTALLLPDGSVLSAGSDRGPMKRTLERFRPPYLFRGPRPSIVEAPQAIAYGDTFEVQTQGDVERFTLARPGSATHAVNFDQRLLELDSSGEGTTRSVTGPALATEAPPGRYMLFALSAAGVPSHAHWVRIAP
jgi:hypothetical protein